VLFPSTVFLFLFLPALLLVYYASPRAARNTVLLLASLFFYAWGETVYVALMLVSIAANYGFGLAISSSTAAAKRRWLVLAIAANLASLAWFKYAAFLAINVNVVFIALDLPPMPVVDVHLPLGISFFTFQAMSYVIDVYRGTCAVQRRLDRVALYICLFPQLIAGPIVRYHDVAQQLTGREHRAELFVSGMQRFIFGLAKKMLIANTVGEVADKVFALPAAELSTGLAWLGIVCYALQIYFDFSAYSDMAIGLGRMFGFRFLENFNYPYVATSLTEFWRRWHISLSRWFRDYLYIPLGGNRGSPVRTYANLCIVFLLCGFWHGASWNFIIWGALHGAFLVVERAGFSTVLQRLPRLFRHLYTLFVVLIAWVYFRAATLDGANTYVSALFGLDEGRDELARLPLLLTPDVLAAVVCGAALSAPLYPVLRARRNGSHAGTLGAHASGPEEALPGVGDDVGAANADGGNAVPGSSSAGRGSGFAWARSALAGLGYGVLFLLAVAFVAAGTYNPFIYFRF
jgi:alginate O-acetyltransferase complex protein AlgI